MLQLEVASYWLSLMACIISIMALACACGKKSGSIEKEEAVDIIIGNGTPTINDIGNVIDDKDEQEHPDIYAHCFNGEDQEPKETIQEEG